MEQPMTEESPPAQRPPLSGVLEDGPLRYCSFCGGSEKERDFLIAADGGVFICDKCVDVCRDVIGHAREMKRLIELEAKSSNAGNQR